MKHTIALLSALCLAPCITSCVHTDTACLKALPVITQGNILINEAQTALSQAEAFVSMIPSENRVAAEQALERAKSALRVSESMLHAASEACRAPDLPAIFKVFSEAWEVLRGFMGTFGGSGVATVQDPIAYGIGKR